MLDCIGSFPAPHVANPMMDSDDFWGKNHKESLSSGPTPYRKQIVCVPRRPIPSP